MKKLMFMFILISFPVYAEQEKVNKPMFGEKWPLTVSEGTLDCNGSKGVGKLIFIDSSSNRYALNGLAIGDKRNKPIDPIWKDDPAVKGLKISMSSLIERGLKLCK